VNAAGRTIGRNASLNIAVWLKITRQFPAGIRQNIVMAVVAHLALIPKSPVLCHAVTLRRLNQVRMILSDHSASWGVIEARSAWICRRRSIKL
jgi:hypothetical protein